MKFNELLSQSLIWEQDDSSYMGEAIVSALFAFIPIFP